MDTRDQFQNILNFRDVGLYINKLLGSPALRESLLFRSARPDEASLADRQRLVGEYNIKTIIDLRSNTELINAAKKRQQVPLVEQSAALPSSGDAISVPVQIPGIHYVNVNLNGKGFERHLVWQLKSLSLAKLIVLMALGYRTQGISILGKELMLPRGLSGLGIDTLDHSGPEIKELFNILANQEAWPVMIHCTQGKDRTGITVLLILLLCDVPMSAINQDYILSEKELEPEKESRMEEIASIGLDESFAGCPPDFCDKIMQHLETKYNGVRSYLRSIGVTESQTEVIRSVLAAKESST